VYVSSCAFDVGDNTALDNETLDRFYGRSGFRPIWDIQGGSTLMIIDNIDNIVIKNDISLIENELVAETFARNARKRIANQTKGEVALSQAV